MSTYAIRHPEAAVLHGFAVLLRAGARKVSLAAQKLDAWLEARRLAADARRDLSEMSDRELRDIGLDRGDIGSRRARRVPSHRGGTDRCHHLRSVDAVVNVPAA